MVVFHVIVGLERGGAETMLFRLISALPHHKHIIVSLTSVGTIGRLLIESGHTVYAIDLRLPLFWRSLYTLWRLIKIHKPDAIQTWMYHSDLLGGLVGRLAGISNIIWNVRNTEVPQKSGSLTGLVIRVCAMLSHTVPRAIVCCAHSALERHARLGYRRDRMIFIPNGYDSRSWMLPTQSKAEIKLNLGVRVGALIIGIVGRYDRLKGYDVFIEAAGLLTDRSSRLIQFIMVGRNIDENNTELCALISAKGGRAQFKLMGEQNDVSQIMSTFDIFCLASRGEGFPNVVAEAMLMQVPCVVTDVGDSSLIVGKVGWVVPPNQPTALAEALLTVANMSAAQRAEVGRHGRGRVLSEFDIDAVAQRYNDLYSIEK
jgi:glycosyltransferase involved in cell wall biosynthesis